MQVDDIRMFVFQRCVPVRVAMGLRFLPALVLVAVVFIMDVQVFVIQRVVPVYQFARSCAGHNASAATVETSVTATSTANAAVRPIETPSQPASG